MSGSMSSAGISERLAFTHILTIVYFRGNIDDCLLEGPCPIGVRVCGPLWSLPCSNHGQLLRCTDRSHLSSKSLCGTVNRYNGRSYDVRTNSHDGACLQFGGNAFFEHRNFHPRRVRSAMLDPWQLSYIAGLSPPMQQAAPNLLACAVLLRCVMTKTLAGWIRIFRVAPYTLRCFV